MTLASIAGAVPMLVKRIVSRRVPSKITQEIISWIAIVMTALHSIRARPNKGKKNEPVNKSLYRTLWTGSYGDNQMAGSVLSLAKKFPFVFSFGVTPNASVITDAVAWIIRDDFVNGSRIVKSHCHSPGW